jgi:hypothetical protein
MQLAREFPSLSTFAAPPQKGHGRREQDDAKQSPRQTLCDPHAEGVGQSLCVSKSLMAMFDL